MSDSSQDSNWGNISAEKVSSLMNFNRNDPSWTYDPNDNASMAAKQAEGAAYLWNTLALKNIAILADEVGMGKTFQAIAVACLLWKMKPNAKILVMAPNRDICAHWQGEYQTFLKDHYKEIDHLIRNAADGGPVHEAIQCRRLSDLVHSLKKGGGNFYLTTIHSLSGLVPMEQKSEGRLLQQARKAAEKIHNDIIDILGEDGFDLIIIDEAHHFRRSQGKSQRAHAARAFFGEETRLAQKTLLMTATPSHSGVSDVANILSYFIDKDVLDENNELSHLLNTYALRRLRLMQGGTQLHHKHHYRAESAPPATFEENPEAELFFALYQKKLVKEIEHSKAGKKFLYGFLEGFESIGTTDQTRNTSSQESDADQDVDQENEGSNSAFRSAPDTAILQKLTKQYYDKFAEFPEHPKYGFMVKSFLPRNLFSGNRDLHEDKHLVFVRRIPSVRELTQRINRAYDNISIEHIMHAWGLKMDDPKVVKWQRQKWSRDGYIELIESIPHNAQNEDLAQDLDDDDDMEVHEDNSRLGSLVADLFVTKKGIGRGTDCSNVSLRFRKPESLFSLFLEPPSNYTNKGYSHYYKSDGVVFKRDNYQEAARGQRLSSFDTITQKLEVETAAESCLEAYDTELPTAWSLLYNHLNQQQQTQIDKWLNEDPAILENFSQYIKTGFLFASPVIIELYCWWTVFNNADEQSGNVQEKYIRFTQFVSAKLSDSLLSRYFTSALESFEALCTKIKRQELKDWGQGWQQLTSLQNPAWYASGETSNRQRIILGFNSPFYPNVLVATSVFQEGVNLHLQCRKVHHYGIAGSPGDNEQRAGRVDRLFGKLNNQLRDKGTTELEISYPYLANSFDEDQVASFIVRKHEVEEKMDYCLPTNTSSSVEMQHSTVAWRDFLRQPSLDHESVDDPYPAKFGSEFQSGEAYRESSIHVDTDLSQHIFDVCAATINHDQENILDVDSKNHPNALLLIDPVVHQGDKLRHQPILVERNFSAAFSSLVNGTVYYLTLKTPLASRVTIKQSESDLLQATFNFVKKHQADFPLVQLAVDHDSVMNHFYLHMKVDLPIFVNSGHLEMLSHDEVSMAIEQLKEFSDYTENTIFIENNQDIAKEHLDIYKHLKNDARNTLTPKASVALGSNGIDDQWTILNIPGGEVASCSHSMSESDFNHLYGGLRRGKDSEEIWLLYLNHQYPFLNFSKRRSKFIVSINYPACDFQANEQSVLSLWLQHCT